jgi:poly-beta-1,6-N-acetyl-D-glucosamine synthase
MMEILFWSAVLVIAYVYVGYPALLAAWAKLAPKPVRPAESLPTVSIVMAARNEGAVLARRLDNLLALDYPADRVQIIVVSDGSTDDTAKILAAYAGRVQSVLMQPGGKAIALNVAVARARNEILVFADARQEFAPDALKALVRPFGDPAVGGVSGELVLDSEDGPSGSIIGAEVGRYWRYEKWLRRQESSVGSMLGATGAIYALRRRLWRSLRPNTILDDVMAPMQAVLAGTRIVFAEGARAYDRVAPAAAEFRRKTRTLAGNYQILGLQPRLLLPGVNPVWLQYVSHKVGRLIVPWALVVLFASSGVLAAQHPFYAFAFVSQVVFYVLAAYGALLEGPPIPRLSFTFVMMNWAAVAGLLALTRGKRVWR